VAIADKSGERRRRILKRRPSSDQKGKKDQSGNKKKSCGKVDRRRVQIIGRGKKKASQVEDNSHHIHKDGVGFGNKKISGKT